MVFGKILVPHDNSQHADKALKLSVQIANIDNEHPEIILLHVIPEIPIPPRLTSTSRSKRTGDMVTFSDYLKEVYQDLRDEMQKDLEQKCKEYGNERIKITTMVVLGDVADKIIECSNNEKIDLVIGSVGLKGISGFFKRLGSVSRSVSERVTCPIMIVR